MIPEKKQSSEKIRSALFAIQGKLAFSCIDKQQAYMGQPTGKFGFTLVVDKNSPALNGAFNDAMEQLIQYAQENDLTIDNSVTIDGDDKSHLDGFAGCVGLKYIFYNKLKTYTNQKGEVVNYTENDLGLFASGATVAVVGYLRLISPGKTFMQLRAEHLKYLYAPKVDYAKILNTLDSLENNNDSGQVLHISKIKKNENMEII